jgi:transposase
MADGLTGRDTGRIRAAGWGTDVHPLTRVGNPIGGLGADVSGGALMLQLTPQSRIFLAVEPVDFRRGIDGLAALCRQRLAQNPLEGAVYVFRNRRSTALKLLLYDGQGFWLCTKRLSQGRFQWWPRAETAAWRLSARELHILLWNGRPDAARMAEDWRRVA